MTQRRILDETAVAPASAAITLPRKVLARYALATLGSRTRDGGEVIARAGQAGDDFQLACVGDKVRYADGSESVITSGAGRASTFGTRPVALVGSHVANGDHIVTSRHSMGEIVVYEGDEPIPGLLQPGFGLPCAAGQLVPATEEA